MRLGITIYFTGEPCKHGHVSERFVNSRQCYECLRQKRGTKARGKRLALRVKVSPSWCSMNKERANQNARRWRKRNAAKHAASNAQRRAQLLRATPSWADHNAIHAIYADAQRISRETGVQHHVDHIFPLRSEWVCGLHVEGNLQVLPATQNLSKSNHIK